MDENELIKMLKSEIKVINSMLEMAHGADLRVDIESHQAWHVNKREPKTWLTMEIYKNMQVEK